MNNSLPLALGPDRLRTIAVWGFSLALALLPAAGLRAEASATALHISRPIADAEGLLTFQLDWDATSNASYRAQSAARLAPGAWHTIDVVTPANSSGVLEIKGRSIPENSVEFFRLILPSPQISSVEPAIVAPGAPVDFYVVGQCFPTNATLHINSLPQKGVLYQSSSSLVMPAFTPSGPGTYQFDLVVSGQVVSSFNVVCADAVANPELVLQGPPLEPPASPGAAWLSKKGYDYYQAQSSLRPAGLQNNPAFQENMAQGEMPGVNGAHYRSRKGYQYYQAQSALSAAGLHQNPYFAGGPLIGEMPPTALLASGLSRKGYDYYQASSAATFEVQEGKKGLNAVNVKLARIAGGADDEDQDCGGNCDELPGTLLMPALMKAKEKANRTKCANNLRSLGIEPFSGEVQECAVDLVIPGRCLDFLWARTYNSRLGRTRAATNGWTFSYDLSLQPRGGDILIHNGTGRADTFKLQTNGVYTCPEFFSEGTLSNDVFRLTFADTGYWEFNPLIASADAGKLARIVDRNGNTMTLGYDTSGRLAQVVDDLGRTNAVAYTTAGQLASVTDFSGRTVTYAYYGSGQTGGSPGDLKSVTSPPVTGTPNGNDFPDGKTTTYTYSTGYPTEAENHLLLSVLDAEGQTVSQFVYQHNQTDLDFLRCISAQEWTNPPTQLRCFPRLPTHLNGYATSSCIVNDSVGNVSESFYDARGRLTLHREYTGRAAPGQPVTNVLTQLSAKLRPADPDYFESQWRWNNDSLCTAEISPGGRQLRCLYESDFDPASPARKRADCRVVRELAASPVDLDGDGAADTSERVWRYEYDPRFGAGENGKYFIHAIHAGSSKGGLRQYNPAGEYLPGDTAVFNGTIWQKVDNSEAPLTSSRTRVNDLENVLKNLGLLGRSGNGGINEKLPFATLHAAGKAGGYLDHPEPGICPSANDGFVTAATDPRGNVTTAGYDPQGNQIIIRCRKRPDLLTAEWDSVLDEFLAYNAHGQLTAITNAPDASGRRRVDTFSYYASGPQAGRLQSIVLDEPGLHLASGFEYDARGNLTRCVDPRTNDWLFAYNTLDQLVQSSSATLSLCFCRIEWKYAYDANDNLVACTAPVFYDSPALAADRTHQFQYDPLHRLTASALAVDAARAQTNRFVYDGNGRCVLALGPDAVSGADPHQAVAYAFDERGLLFRAIAAAGSSLAATNEYDYDGNGNTARINKIDSFTIKQKIISHDGFDRPAAITDPMGNQAVCFYDANDNLKVVRLFGETNDVPGSVGNLRLAESRFEYDGFDRCVVVHDLHFNPATQAPVGDGKATTQIAFAPCGQCRTVTDDLGHVTTLGYDTAGRFNSVTSPDARTSFAILLDANGNATNCTRTDIADLGPPQLFSVAIAYDALDRCVSSTDGAGNTSSCAYDSLGRIVRVTDPKGNDSTYAYDLLDNCLAGVDYVGTSSAAAVIRSRQAAYDTSSRCLSSTDANGNTAGFGYDSLGNCAWVAHADGTYAEWVWSPRSNLIRATDANGTTTTNTYDLNSRIIHRDIACRNVLATTTVENFSYDGCSQLVLADNNAASLRFGYDSLGNCVHETLNGLTTASTYDALGNRLSLAYPGGRSLAYAYNPNHACTNITEQGAALAGFAYAGRDRLQQVTRANGTRTLIAYDGLTGKPNAQNDHGFGRISRIRHEVVATSAAIEDRTFGYDANQNKVTRDMTAPFALNGAAHAQGFQYDAIDRLGASLLTTNGAIARLVSYGLDPMGNRTNITGAACSGDYLLDPASPPADYQRNQYTASPCELFSYDNHGNLVSRASAVGSLIYQYDYASRLVAARTVMEDGSGTGSTITNLVAAYAYDALGRRVSKTVYAGGLPPATRQYCYDGTCAIEERVDGVVAATYVSSYQLCYTVNSGLSWRQGTQDYYLHTDDQGNTLALTDASGAVVERYDYEDYGAVTFLAADGSPLTGGDGMPAVSSAVGNPYLFHGLGWDPEAGLYSKLGGAKSNPLYEDKGGTGENPLYDAKTGRAVSGPGSSGDPLNEINDVNRDRTLNGSNPWSGGVGGGARMKSGTVKFFNDAKGFGFKQAGRTGTSNAAQGINSPNLLI